MLFVLVLGLMVTWTTQQETPQNRCDATRTIALSTPCTSCAASPFYAVNIGDRTVELPGCRHTCEKEVTEHRCCPYFWGPLCLRNGTCVCEAGYTGFACQECKNKNAYGDHCQSECNCVHGECNRGPGGDGQCYCQPPYSGPRCDKARFSYHTVTASCANCTAYSHCKGEGDQAACLCLPRFMKVGRICSGVCSKDECGPNGQCKYLGAGKFQCTCKEGFEGDGKICAPVNPCTTDNGGCPTNSTVCVLVSAGKSHCVCKDGMESDDPSKGCVLKSACTETTCDRTARCETGMDGLPRCFCQPYEIADGRRCYGNILERVLELNRKGSQEGKLYGSVTLFGQHLYKDLEGNDFQTLGGQAVRFKSNKRFIFMKDPDTVYSIIQSDIAAANGIIHVIDQPITNIRPDKSINDQNCGAPMPLRGPGPLTVFVPTNNAVDRFRDGSIIYMLTDAKHKLQELLRHHMYSSASVTVDQIASMSEIHTMANQIIAVNVSSEDSHLRNCEYQSSPSSELVSINGCAKYCNTTRTRAECCKGFYGPDCKPCIGGFKNPCYDKGVCHDGIQGDGMCSCKPGFEGVACHICSNTSKHGENCDEDCRCVHGICDNRPGSMGVCRSGTCLEGYSGEFCDKTAKPCNSDGVYENCHIHAYCSYSGDHTMCVCMSGYEGDGHICTPVNPCIKPSRGGCDPNAQCVYAGPGNVSCVCNEGWTGDGLACVEINNCLLERRGGCHVNADCQNECICKTGYMGDGKVCDLINPCTANNGGCHMLATCEPQEGGGRTCACPEGYGGDGKATCYGSILEQVPHLNLSGNITALVPTSAALKRFKAMDDDFWFDPYRLPHLVKVHFLDGVFSSEDLKQEFNKEIATLNPKTKWEIKNNSGEAMIQNATILSPDIPTLNGYIHVIDQVLTPHLSDIPALPPTLMQLLNSTPSFSLFRKAAMAYNLSESIGRKEYTVFIPTDGAIKEHLKMTNTTELDSACCSGYFGHSCLKCPGKIDNWCSNNGKCQDGIFGTGECLCNEGFHGTACEDCEPGKYGKDCKSEIDPCESDNGHCSKDANCTKTLPGERVCTCKEGFTGDGVVCLEIDGCTKNKGGCHSRAECIKTGPNLELMRHPDARWFNRNMVIYRVSDLLSTGRFTAFIPHSDYNGNFSDVVYINEDAKIITSDYDTSDGVIHFIDKVLLPYDLDKRKTIPPTLNVTAAAEAYGYTIFSKLLQTANLMSMVQNHLHHPLTMLWPTDEVFNSLPEERKKWLYSEDHRDKLAAYLKAHIIRDTKGDIVVDDGNAKLIERHLLFDVGVAYGIDQLLEPPSMGARCDSFEEVKRDGKSSSCSFSRFSSMFMPYRRYSVFNDDLFPFSPYGHLHHRRRAGCQRECVKVEWVPRCCKNHYGRDCQVCPGGLEAPCSNRGQCRDGKGGTGECQCQPGSAGIACELCKQNYYGANCTKKKPTCTPECHPNATGINVNCTCLSAYSGDGYSCAPIDRCVVEQNGGCSDFATCTFTGPNERDCECQDGYVGNGIQCLEKVVPPIDRCQEDNGGCDPKADCKDLHFHENTAGVFHLRSPLGKYKLNYTEAEAACQAEGAVLATFSQLSDAQQLGMHLCVAGWMDGKKVGYPTRFPSVKCGDNHVGVVLYKDPVDTSSKYDAYCYRVKDVFCECGPDYVGNGDYCNGNIVTTLSSRDIEYHISANNSVHLYDDLKHGAVIVSRLGYNLSVTVSPTDATLSSLSAQFQAVMSLPNLSSPVVVSHPSARGHSATGAVTSVLITFLIIGLVAGLGYYLLKHRNDGFRFQYFKNDDDDEGTPRGEGNPALVSIPNPLYNGYTAFAEPFGDSPEVDSSDTHHVLD
ncbi:hypothetical protein JZ751_029826 [Albula glossodonta]|uniref:Stabilin-2 n=1 Tax=Albula glossodonta TaxID=121402 RepID=A0A8T2NHE3_9TELE|nr:hypothetical protein JZ751_029826 [Albula glossodonta]